MKKSSPKTARIILDPQHSRLPKTEEIKFDLYLKIREIKEISLSLQKILLMNREKRTSWVEQNEDLIVQLLDSFMEDSMLVMNGMQLDGEAMSMSVELMATMKNVFNVLQSLVKSNKEFLN